MTEGTPRYTHGSRTITGHEQPRPGPPQPTKPERPELHTCHPRPRAYLLPVLLRPEGRGQGSQAAKGSAAASAEGGRMPPMPKHLQSCTRAGQSGGCRGGGRPGRGGSGMGARETAGEYSPCIPRPSGQQGSATHVQAALPSYRGSVTSPMHAWSHEQCPSRRTPPHARTPTCTRTHPVPAHAMPCHGWPTTHPSPPLSPHPQGAGTPSRNPHSHVAVKESHVTEMAAGAARHHPDACRHVEAPGARVGAHAAAGAAVSR